MIDLSSPYLWGTISVFSFGWGAVSILQRSKDRITRLVRVSLLFSIVFLSLTFLWITSEGAPLIIFSNYVIVFISFLLAGIIIRFLPFYIKIAALLLIAAGVAVPGAAVSSALPAQFSQTFGTAVNLNEQTLELRIRYKDTEQREESFFINTGSGAAVEGIHIHAVKPSPFLYMKRGLYFYLDILPRSSGNAVSRFPEMSTAADTIIKIADILHLAEHEIYSIQIPSGILRLYFLDFNSDGIPSVSAEY